MRGPSWGWITPQSTGRARGPAAAQRAGGHRGCRVTSTPASSPEGAGPVSGVGPRPCLALPEGARPSGRWASCCPRGCCPLLSGARAWGRAPGRVWHKFTPTSALALDREGTERTVAKCPHAHPCAHTCHSHTRHRLSKEACRRAREFGATRRARPRGLRRRGLRGREPRKPVQRGGKKKGGRCEEAVGQMRTKDGQEGWGSPAPDPHLHCPARQAGPTTRLPLCCTPFSWHVLLFVCNMLMSCTRQELRGQSRLTLKSGKNKAVEGKFAFSETGAPQGLEPAGILQELALPLSGPRPRLCPGRPLTWSRPAPLSPRGPQLEHISLGHCLRGPV